MEPFHQYVEDYRRQLEKGAIQKAYRGLMEYIMDLRAYFGTRYPEYHVSGNIYYGYMDMTYFSFFPRSLKDRKLKVAIVFLHDSCRFEAWLAGYNRQVQAEYWRLFEEKGWDKYRLVSPAKGVDAILEHVLVEQPDFSDLDMLTKQIEKAALVFIGDVEHFLLER